ncbi:Hypothetical protein SmN45_1310 [Serratia marcescens]|nr:Hypothetical protein SmN45_1310 [Serratia marcescens]
MESAGAVSATRHSVITLCRFIPFLSARRKPRFNSLPRLFPLRNSVTTADGFIRDLHLP